MAVVGEEEEIDEEEKERMSENPGYLPSFSDQMIRDTSSRRVWRCTICNYETTDGKKKGRFSTFHISIGRVQ